MLGKEIEGLGRKQRIYGGEVLERVKWKRGVWGQNMGYSFYRRMAITGDEL